MLSAATLLRSSRMSATAHSATHIYSTVRSTAAALATTVSMCASITSRRTIPALQQCATRTLATTTMAHGHALSHLLPPAPVPAPEEAVFDPIKSKRTGLVARKVGMTTMWDRNAHAYAATILQVSDNVVVRTRWDGLAGCYMVDVAGFASKPARRTLRRGPRRAVLFHMRRWAVEPRRWLASFRISPECYLPSGTELSAAHLMRGQRVDAIAVTVGRGFQGVMKRHGFHGSRRTHGVTKNHRKPGSVGSQTPGRVLKGKRMPGRMGGKRTTIHGLEVTEVDAARGLIFVRGSVPGPVDRRVLLRDAHFPRVSGTCFPDASAVPFPCA